MRSKLLTVVILSGAMLSACQSGYGYSSRVTKITPSNYISVENDPFEKWVTYTSEVGQSGYLGDTISWILTGENSRDKEQQQYYVQWGNVYTSENWRYYTRSNNNKAEQLSFATVDRDVSSCDTYTGCVFTEIFNIYFTSEQMQEASIKGLTFKVFARDGTEKTTLVATSLVQALLTAMQSQ